MQKRVDREECLEMRISVNVFIEDGRCRCEEVKWNIAMLSSRLEPLTGI
jgi:hypothetical protein